MEAFIQQIISGLGLGLASCLLLVCLLKLDALLLALGQTTRLVSVCVKAVDGARQSIFNRTVFFWTINIVFMSITAYHAAPFFGSVTDSLPGLEGLGPYLGLPVTIVLDGITIVFMQARLEANYKRDRKKAAMYLRYVFASASLNTIANLYTDIQHFDASKYSNVGTYMQFAAPLFLSIFPVFLVAVSKAADEMVNIKPVDKVNVEEYREQEEKRVQILEAQNEYLDREAKAERRQIEIQRMQHENALLRRGKTIGEKRVFFLMNWLFPQNKQVDITAMIEEVRKVYEPQIQAMQNQLETFIQQSQQQYQFAGQYVAQEIRKLDLQRDDDNRLFLQHISQIKTTLSTELSEQISGQFDMLISTRLSQGKQERNTDPMMAFIPGDNTSHNRDDTSRNTGELSGAKGKDQPADMSRYTGLITNYPQIDSWLSGSVKSATIADIVKATGHTAKMVNNRVKDGTIKKANKPHLFRVNSVLEWLLIAPLPKRDNQADNHAMTDTITPDNEAVMSDVIAANNQGVIETFHEGDNQGDNILINEDITPDIEAQKASDNHSHNGHDRSAIDVDELVEMTA